VLLRYFFASEPVSPLVSDERPDNGLEPLVALPLVPVKVLVTVETKPVTAPSGLLPGEEPPAGALTAPVTVETRLVTGESGLPAEPPPVLASPDRPESAPVSRRPQPSRLKVRP
jgi:hypothetical protein